MVAQNIYTASGPITRRQLFALQWRLWVKLSSHWLVLFLFAIAGGYGLYQGYSDKKEKFKTIQAFRQEKDSLLQEMITGITADTLTEKGKAGYQKSSVINSALWNTRLPSYKLPVSTALYCVGQSDVFTYYYLFAAENFEMQLLKQTETTNPIRALAGHFDVSFWVIYLLPLFILLFSFNALSAEREAGNWRLIAAQGITPKAWLQSKLLVVATECLFLLFEILIGGTVINAVIFQQLPDWSDGLFFLSAIVYLFFWLALFYFISSLHHTTAWNALAGGVAWIGVCLVLPIGISKAAEIFIPVDNTVVSTLSRRPQNPRIESDKVFAAGIIKKLGQKEPRYANANVDTARPALLLHTYHAWHRLLHVERWPQLQQYYTTIENRQQVTDGSSILNPAGSTDGVFTALADNDAVAFHHFTNQTEQLHTALDDVMYPALFADKGVTQYEYSHLPQFHYQRNSAPASLPSYLLLMTAAGIVLGRAANHRLKKITDENR